MTWVIKHDVKTPPRSAKKLNTPTLMHFVCVPASNNDGLLAIPGWIISHDFSMCGDILGRQLRRFIGLGVDPTKWLHFL